MLVSEAISKINYRLRGLDDDAPVSGSDEYAFWLDTLNGKKDELYRDINQNWSGTFEARSIGTISASETPSFDLDEDFLAPSSNPYVITTDGNKVELTLIHPDEQSSSERAVYLAGTNPQTLYITNEVTATESIVGGTLFMPGYWLPEDMTSDNDELPFPDPYWGVMAAAAEIAFSDIIYETKSADLNAKANALYMQMVRNNRRGVYKNPRKTPRVTTNRIRSARR